jgi:hypothetical protein
MAFSRECEMASPVIGWLNRQRLQTKAEFRLPWGVCDIVAMSFDESCVRKRLSIGQRRPIGPLQRIELLRCIPDLESGETITVNDLEKEMDGTISATKLCAEIEKLIADGFVSTTCDGSLLKLNGWAPMHRRIIAVELKLSRVADAFAQALSNRAFATESFVAFPLALARRLAQGTRRQSFVDNGIGILGVTSRRCDGVLPAALKMPPDVTLQMHCSERFWRTRGSSTSVAVPRARVS